MSNITDIDDKIIDRAQREGRPWQDITTKCESIWFKAMDGIGVKRPTVTPHATEYVERMVELIAELLASDKAYETSDGVYLDCSTVPGYGLLARRSLELVDAATVADPATMEQFRRAMDDDLNTAGALDQLFRAVRSANTALDAEDDATAAALAAAVREMCRAFGLALREEDFVLAAELAGCSRWRIIVRHMVPTFLSHIIATSSLAIRRSTRPMPASSRRSRRSTSCASSASASDPPRASPGARWTTSTPPSRRSPPPWSGRSVPRRPASCRRTSASPARTFPR